MLFGAAGGALGLLPASRSAAMAASSPTEPDGLAFAQPAERAVSRSIQGKLEERVSAADFGLRADGKTDGSDAIQAAIAFAQRRGGGVVYLPPGEIRCNLELASQVTLQGDGMRETVLRPAKRGHVVRSPFNRSVVRTGLRDVGIVGDPSHEGCDGVHLESSAPGTWCDTVTLENVHISACGGSGVLARGASAAGPFVQRLRLINCEIRQNVAAGLRLIGCVLESSCYDSVLAAGATTEAASRAVSLEFEPRQGGSFPSRVAFYSSIFSAFEKHPGGFAPAVWIGAAAQVGFYSCGFEYSDPAIFTDHAPFAGGFVAIGCAFNFSEPTHDAVWLKRSDMVLIDGCSFASATKLTNAIRFQEGMSMNDIKGVRIGNNSLANVETYVSDKSSFYQQIVGTTLRRYRDYMVVLGPNGRPGDLTAIVDDSGTRTFAPGAEVTLVPFAGRENVTVRHGRDNILLQGTADYALDRPEKSLTLRWNLQRGKWVEASRS